MVPRGGTLLALVALALAIALGFRAASPRPPPRDATAADAPREEENCATATDWQCFSSGRRERQVDETFAGYVARASFAAIMEDPQVGGVDPNTGETDEAVAQAFVRRVTVLYEEERKKLGLGKAAPRDADAKFPPLEELKSPEAFDAYSYAQFAAAAETLTGGRERRALTPATSSTCSAAWTISSGPSPSAATSWTLVWSGPRTRRPCTQRRESSPSSTGCGTR